MFLLDSLIKALGLLIIDVHEPTVSIFPANEIPAASLQPEGLLEPVSFYRPLNNSENNNLKPDNFPLDLPRPSVPVMENGWDLMLKQPGWPDIHNKAEVEKEEIRRLCWNALVIASIFREHTAYLQQSAWDLHILKQENVRP